MPARPPSSSLNNQLSQVRAIALPRPFVAIRKRETLARLAIHLAMGWSIGKAAIEEFCAQGYAATTFTPAWSKSRATPSSRLILFARKFHL
jgi:hypothetical protein